jgi:hypothetical protein
LVKQAFTPWSLQILRGSGSRSATFRQRPGEPGRLQLRQAPSQRLSQHTPSTHWPESQSSALVQTWPFLRFPQIPWVTPPTTLDTQAWPGSQTSVPLRSQLVSHAPLEQRKGAQSISSGGRQFPRPSQVLGVCSKRPEHSDDLQTVFSRQSVHRPAPSHAPVRPQVLASWPLHSGSVRLTGRYVQRPTEPVSLQVTQAPVHAMLQHT